MEQPEKNQRAIGIDSPFLMRIGIIIVLTLIAAVFCLHLILPSALRPALIFEPPLLLPILNTIFLFFVSCVVSYIAMRSYLISGLPTILLFGCGVLTLGVGALLAGWLIGPEGPNVNVTIFNISAFISSTFHTATAIVDLMKKPPEADPMRRRRKLIVGYLGVLVLVVLVVLAAIGGIMPLFFIQGVGPTTLRQAVLAIALVLFIVLSSFKMIRFVQERARFLYWYSLALALLAITMVGAFLQPSVGSPMGWVGRSAQYLAGIYFLMAVFSALRDAQTRGVGLTAAIADLFHESRVYWQDILATVSDAIVSCDDRGRILQWNEAAERIFGYPRAEVLGKSHNVILPDKHDIDLERLGDPGLSTPGIIEMELKKKNGTSFSGEISASTRRLSIGKVITLLIRDITERKQAEDETQRLLAVVQEEKDRLSALVNSISDEIWFADTEKRFTLANPSALREFGFSSTDPIDVKKFAESLEVLRPDGSPRPVEEAPPLRSLQGKVVMNQEEIIRTPRTGELRFRQVSSAPVRDAGGHIIGSISVVRDITERKRAEEELRRSRDELEMRVQERTEELQAINEQLRVENEERLRVEIELRESESRLRELSTALLSAQERERKLIAQEIHDSLGASLAATKFKVETVLTEMGDDHPQTRIALESVIPIVQGTIEEARRIQMSLRPSVLDDLGILPTINWSCRQFESIYPSIRITKEIDIEEDEVPKSLKIVIYRILQEALNNIAKHSKTSVVLLFLQKTDQAIQLVIRDRGQGFNPEEAYSRKGLAKGLGLDSMKERTELSGGSLEIESVEGKGTTIRASWPLGRHA